jgi:hypothetical protein
MGLDIYAGTLTRYYAQNWKTVTQQWAEKNGIRFNSIRPNEDLAQDEDIPVEVIQKNMQHWSHMISNGLSSSSGKSYEAWDEKNEKDYFTDKPDWCAFGALLLYGACLKYNLPLPQQVKKDWDYLKEPIITRALEDKELNWSLFSLVEWWLPFDDCFSTRCPTPTGDEIAMGTTGTLLAELRRINELGWNVDDMTILSWSENEGYPTDAKMVDGAYRKTTSNNEYDVQSLAKFTFSIFYQAALFSEKNRVPILMDY